MASEGVQPLRINKTSPGKMSGSAIPRPLSEISPMGIRRNSPSFNQATKKPSFTSTTESSPFDASPQSSPLSFWKSRENVSPRRFDTENVPFQSNSPSPRKRPSVENLKKVNRVTNSNMYAKEQESEFDPDSSSVLSNRPLSTLGSNPWAGSLDLRPSPSLRGHKRTDSSSKIPTLSNPSSPTKMAPSSPLKQQTSPQKSSLSNNSRYLPQNTAGLEEFPDEAESRGGSQANTPRALRQPKSVSFDEQPPQINEYEMVTPDPSSVASGSREGSLESDQYNMDDSFEHGSFDREDSFDESLEDADKTPVVLPEDWRFMSPEAAKTTLAETFDDPFQKPQPDFASPSLRYRGTPEREVGVARSNSTTSENRPLPPLPGLASTERVTSSASTSAVPQPRPASAVSTPRPASMSKADVLSMRASPMPLEERMHLLSIQNDEAARKSAEAHVQELVNKCNASAAEEEADQLADLKPLQEAQEEYKPPPRVSRESILRKVQSSNEYDDDLLASSPASVRTQDRDDIDYANLDPDEPIPSREPSSAYDDDQESSEQVVVPASQTEDEDEAPRSLSPFDDLARESSVIHHYVPEDEDEDASEVVDNTVQEVQTEQYPQLSIEEVTSTRETSQPAVSFVDVVTEVSKADDHGKREEALRVPSGDTSRMSLPEFTSFFDKDDDFGFGLGSYLTPSPPQEHHVHAPEPMTTGDEMLLKKPQLRPSTSDLRSTTSHPVLEAPERPVMPERSVTPPAEIEESLLGANTEERDIGTPDSVIHHGSETSKDDEPSEVEAPEVPQPQATIKASGSKLKTRVSATPADIRSMAATRRHVSGEQPPADILDKEPTRAGSSASQEVSKEPLNRRQSLRKLEMPMAGMSDELGLGLTEEFDRLLEAKKVGYPLPAFADYPEITAAEVMPGQGFSHHMSTANEYIRAQKGYLMRQNTKVVVANSRQLSGESKASDASNDDQPKATTKDGRPTSSRATRSAGNSPRKESAQTWTIEPWNGRMRRQSTRRTNIVSEKRTSLGPAPPMPGQESNVSNALDTVTEDQPIEDADETGERGRLFVKVVGAKELDLPLPKGDRCYFQMTLDNGLHCVTTSWSELGRTAPIGQEFELVVFDDLEFQLLLQTRLERPKSAAGSVQSSSSSVTAKKASAFSRLFTSPKKKREQERKQQEEEARLAEERQRMLEAQRASRQPSAWDLQNELVGPDGSFARAYVALSNHEQQVYGRPCTVDIPAWNEWAVEDKTGASTRSKMGGVQRKPPYRIGTMELQLMYVPRPRDASDDDMPKSMSAAIRQLKEAEATVTRSFEGYLSQQGGDCPYWRRRFFKLNGSKLTAYHDTTRQPRATISLAKASKLIDDKSSLTKTDPSASPTKSRGRRKSAFAEDEEGYMFVEEGFRIRFANGEVIDFYADSRGQKDEWMKVLSEAVGRESPNEKKTWMSIVLARERAAGISHAASKSDAKHHQEKEELVQPRTGSKSVGNSPQKQQQEKFPQLGQPMLNAGPFTNGLLSSGLKENRPPPIDKSPRHSPPSPTKAPHRNSQSAVLSKGDGSLTKGHARTQSSSPTKRDSSPSKRSSAASTAAGGSQSSNSSPRKPTGKRQAVRSMIF